MDHPEPDGETLDLVFGALADPVRRAILARLDGEDLLVTELAAPFDISLQAVSRHIQVLVRAGLVTQERTGRISRCRLDTGPILNASLWLNRYSRYWQSQFDTLAMWLDAMSPPLGKENPHAVPRNDLQKDDRKTGRVPPRDRRTARQDAGAAANRRARGGR
ncbi:MAG TPA: metalloregulator ArsR/SmtB family transcription factor [Stellaceae bacterium]|nr:metalloregulator ArsR/SmtB family transcription factor [Stellaceae bacterium]